MWELGVKTREGQSPDWWVAGRQSGDWRSRDPAGAILKTFSTLCGISRRDGRIFEASIGVDQQYPCQSENERKRDIPNPDPSPAHPGQKNLKQHRRKNQTEGQHPSAGDFQPGPLLSCQSDQQSRGQKEERLIHDDVSLQIRGLDEKETMHETCTRT